MESHRDWHLRLALPHPLRKHSKLLLDRVVGNLRAPRRQLAAPGVQVVVAKPRQLHGVQVRLAA